jgi:hypothetical protein
MYRLILILFVVGTVMSCSNPKPHTETVSEDTTAVETTTPTDSTSTEGESIN